MRSLEGLTVVMMGASGGIGTATALKIANTGAKLAISSSRRERVDELCEKLSGTGAEVYADVVDITDEKQVEAFMAAVAEKFGRVDILLNFAGLSITAKLDTFSVEDYAKVMDVNVKGMVFSTKYFVEHVNSDEGALIINFGSMAAKRANANAPHYSAAKAAVNMFTDGLAQQLKGKNIRMTVINPGPTDTSFYEGRIPPEKRTDFMQAEDVAEVLEFIMTRNSNIIFHDVMFDSFGFFRR